MERQLRHFLIPRTICITSSSLSFFMYKMEIVIVTAIQGPHEEEMINWCALLRISACHRDSVVTVLLLLLFSNVTVFTALSDPQRQEPSQTPFGLISEPLRDIC